MKKLFRIITCLLMIIYIFSAPYYLNNIYAEKYLINKSSSEWSGVITMWDIPRLTVNGSEFGWIKDRIAAYQKLNPNVRIDLRQLNYDDKKDIAFKAALSEEDYPDIMPLYIDGEVIPLDNVMPLDLFDNEENLISIKDPLISTVYKDEKIWGVPVYYSVNVLIINTGIIDSLGIKIPDRLDDKSFLSLLKEIGDKDIQGEIAPFEFYLGEGSNSYMPFLLSDGGNIFSPENSPKADFYDSKVVTGLNKLNNIQKTVKNLHENFGTRTKSEALTDFLEGKTAILAGSLSDVNSLIRRINRGSGFEYKVLPFPIGQTGQPIYYADEIGAYAVMKTDDDGKKEAIMDFLKFLLSEESQLSIELLGKIPAVEGYASEFKDRNHINLFNDSLFLHTMPLYIDRSIIDTANNEIRNMFINNEPATETLYHIQQFIR